MLRATRYEMRCYPQLLRYGEVIHRGMTCYWESCEQPAKCYPEAIHSMIGLFADTKTAEYGAKQIVGSELSSDGIEGLLGIAQLLRNQFACL